MTHHAKMMTDARELEYDFVNHIGWLFQADGCCTDMSGTIAVFQAIDPDVQMIQTWAGFRVDTIYERHHGEWTARVAKGYAMRPRRLSA